MLTLCAGAVWADYTIWAPEIPDGYPTAHKIKAGSTASHANDPEADGNMCWAAATSNLIEYWQSRYCQLTGLSLPEGVPSGSTGSGRASQVFDAIVASWDNKAGGTEPGLYWYFSGCVSKWAAQGGDPVAGSGGYWKDYCERLGYGNTFDALRTAENCYFKGEFSSLPTLQDRDGWQEFVYGGFADFVSGALSGGSLVALNLKSPDVSGGTVGHAITLYGAKYADDGSLAGIYVNDNNARESDLTYLEVKKLDRSIILEDDDKDKGTKEKVTLTYQELAVYLPEDSSGKFSTNGWIINAVGMLDLRIVPEPSTAILSLLALTGLALRRRRAV